jgi:hypothetical protein
MAKTCGRATCIGSDAGGVLPGAGVGTELLFNVEAQARRIGSGSRFIDEPINVIGAAGGEGGARVERAYRIDGATDCAAQIRLCSIGDTTAHIIADGGGLAIGVRLADELPQCVIGIGPSTHVRIDQSDLAASKIM